MFIFRRSFKLHTTIVKQVYKTVLCDCWKDSIPVIVKIKHCDNNMSQRSITSFFKVTPPKPRANIQQNETQAHVEAEEAVTNENSKTGSKRERVESSGSEAEVAEAPLPPPPRSPAASAKNKKSKRQRIESSSSESDTAAPREETIKVEKTDSPKTYMSPKNKKRKTAVSPPSDTESKTQDKSQKNKDNKKKLPSPKVKKESVNETKELTEKDCVSNGDSKRPSLNEENSLDKTQSPKKKVLSIKQEQDESVDKTKVAGVDYNPAKAKYHPVKDACWSRGEEVPYLALARTLEAIEDTSARLRIIEILSNYFRSVIALTPDDLLPSVYLCLNQLAPAYHSLELGIAETYLMKAIGQCTGRTLAQLRGAARGAGLARAAERARAAQRTLCRAPPLTARRLLAALRDIARTTGQASVNKKINKIQSLYVACRHSEARFLIRSLEGKLRIGLAEQSVLQALALAATATPPAPAGVTVLDAAEGLSPEQFKSRVDAAALTLKTTYCECPDYERVVPALLLHGVAALPQHCRLAPGVPLKPMLAHPTRGVSEIFDRFEKEQFTCEWKYDGERAQIHVPGDDAPELACAAIFSRNQEDNTSKYPDVVARLGALLKPSVRSCVLDCEAVAYDTATKQILPFQVLSTRKRKDARADDIKVQVCVFVFDLLFLNGAPLVREPLAERRRLLHQHFNTVEGSWQFATSRDCSTVEEVQQFLEEAVRGSCEGLMVKTLAGDHARYDIARRSHNWLKLKKDYLEGVGDTIDAVVVGAYRGRGKRAGAFGGFLLACYEPAAEQFQSLCKVGTGFSDDDLAALTASLQEHVIDAPRNYYRYNAAHAPDVWVSAAAVWEVRCADLSLSPAHHAALGLVDPEKGISLRFPRFIRVRSDKSPEQATSAQQLADMYLAQAQVRNTAGSSAAAARRLALDDFY